MNDAMRIEQRTNPHAKRFMLTTVALVVIVLAIYFLPSFVTLRIPIALSILIATSYLFYLSVMAYRNGPDRLPLIPFVAGTLLTIGGAAFDVTITLIKNPQLNQEGNPFIRAFLDSGYPPEYIYAGGLIAQVLFTALSCILWYAYLAHRKTLISLTRTAKSGSALEFIKAATGGEHLTWRQYFFPMKLSDWAKSYHLFIFTAAISLAYGPDRLILGLQWLGLPNNGPLYLCLYPYY